MNTTASLLAEQSIFAHLIVKRKRTPASKFQMATIGGNSIYHYYSGDALTNVSTEDYSIINLPDTIAYLPKNSIFDEIMLIRSSSPDYRLVRIAPLSSERDGLKRTTVATDSEIKVKKFKSDRKKTTIYTTNYSADLELEPLEDDDDDNDDDESNENASNGAMNSDLTNNPRSIRFNYTNFNDVSSYDGIELSLIPDITSIISTFNANKPMQNAPWYDSLIALYRFNAAVPSSSAANSRTAAYRIISYLQANIATPTPNNYEPDDILRIKRLIDGFVN